ncbi:MAG: DEAD/DEAH box helicase [Candidatus Hydrogenedentes bacterium]|nr:DEAD/DEAH box helicase [Candidatus Hydrogenedentota bacterium]
MPAKTLSARTLSAKAKPRRKVAKKPQRTSRTRKPLSMTLEAWQVALRREYGREQNFRERNLGEDPIFSSFTVHNPGSGRTYRVAIRGANLGDNFCSCPDFAVNTLGTCKHIEWLLAKLARKRGGKKALREGYHPPYSEVYLRYGAERAVHLTRGSACDVRAARLLDRYFDAEGRLGEKAAESFEKFVREARRQPHEIRIYEDVLSFVAARRDDAHRAARIAKDYGGRGGAARLNSLLRVKLYPYQRQGAIFAAKAGRSLIADDMGLGKTIQAIAAVEILARVAGVERVLVVSPTALKHQWRQEVERFAGRDAAVVEGLWPQRKATYASPSFYKLTNYETIERDMELIREWAPDVVILDEAQRIKNWDTRRARAIKQLDSRFAIVLTGTPLENRLSELHSIMEFVDKFHLGPLFKFLHAHQHVDESGRVIGYRDLDKVKESLAGVLVRRRKADVLQELPDRSDSYLFVDMTREQRQVHDDADYLVKKILAKWRKYGFLTEEDQRRLMCLLQTMRMACNSTFLVDKETDHSTKMDECALLLDDVLADPESKVVIFSQWLGTHEQLIRRLEAEGRGYAYYHGSLDGKRRKEALERFKGDADCPILLCTDSGGVGLNLQEASAVIIMDQPWNPAVLEQRIGRVHRLGQHRPVSVYHFISRGGIEEGMLDTLKFKTSMFEGVLDGGESEVFLGGTRMQKFMETVEKVVAATPQDAPVAEAGDARDGGPAEAPAADADSGAPVEPARAPGAATTERPAAAEEAPWNALLQAGLALLGEIEKRGGQGAARSAGGNGASRFVHENKETGRPELRLPMPDPDTAAKIGELLGGIAGALQRLGGGR